MKEQELTQERLKELLHYDPETGIFTWKERQASEFKPERLGKTWNTKWAGKRSGCKGDDGNMIRLLGKSYFSRRLAWFYVYGEWPKAELDNIDCDLWNDKISNLRNATSSDSCHKRIRIRKNKLDLQGVRIDGIGFTSCININKKQVFLGYFKTQEEAHAAYIEAKRLASPEFCML